MKSILIILSLILLNPQADAGTIVYKNMYLVHSLVIGEGITNEDALKDALSTIPEGYIADKSNGPQVECINENATTTESYDFICDTSISGKRN